MRGSKTSTAWKKRAGSVSDGSPASLTLPVRFFHVMVVLQRTRCDQENRPNESCIRAKKTEQWVQRLFSGRVGSLSSGRRGDMGPAISERSHARRRRRHDWFASINEPEEFT